MDIVWVDILFVSVDNGHCVGRHFVCVRGQLTLCGYTFCSCPWTMDTVWVDMLFASMENGHCVGRHFVHIHGQWTLSG